MTSQTKFHLIFNTLGALVGITVVVYIVHSLFYTETEAACSARYPAATRMSLHMSDGASMSPIELQARVGVDEYGVNGNTRMIADAPGGGGAIEVTLATVPDVEKSGTRAANGIFFRWTPPGIGEATSGCLSYRLWLPDDFEFGHGGFLPGIVGAAQAADTEALPLGTRPVWRPDGETVLDVATTGAGYIPFLQSGFALPKGRWVQIEQELVLNTPGQANGIARLWLDGELKAESTNLDVRKDASAAISGVLSDIGYARMPDKPGTLRITPFEMAWK
jgi:hypothetical protein